ncbi:MAG: SDR family NAD(P)-dependent oxidoreductase [Caldimonas sp.]
MSTDSNSTTVASSVQAALPRRALVTGSTSGIGRASAIQLARDGFEVIVQGRDASRGADTVREIEAVGGRATFVAADLGDVGDVRRLGEMTADVDVLVNNAGYAWFGPTANLDAAGFDAMFATNVRAAYLLVGAIAPAMATRGRGSIVNLGSMAGQIGLAGGAAYSATKASLAALTRAWAAEFSPSGVRVNAVAPGPIYTASPAEFITALGQTTLLKRAGQPEEIAALVSFLASDRASYITGATLAADGGRSAV